MSERFNIRGLLAARPSWLSYHVAAEQHLRIEFRNMRAGESVDPFSFAGELVVTCYRGIFAIALDGELPSEVNELDQLVVSTGARVELECTEDGTIQLIWSPAHAPALQG
jgi:hypothetical protein